MFIFESFTWEDHERLAPFIMIMVVCCICCVARVTPFNERMCDSQMCDSQTCDSQMCAMKAVYKVNARKCCKRHVFHELQSHGSSIVDFVDYSSYRATDIATRIKIIRMLC